eukprot:TRINITY_DN331_c0_g1_i1.p2 TRINITY_DN331_c0_g1~~TRINITY_DN331_c0_g1_i1.p2  ORF type:complete len:227 (+),score=76.17 TRINITY_DN331_c0_g1_i1:742-1422(+)
MFSRKSKDKDTGHLDECPTAANKEELVTLAKELLEKAHTIETAEWTPVAFHDKEGDIVLFEREVKDSPTSGLKAIGTIPAPPAEVFAMLWDTDVEGRKKWDVGLSEYKLVTDSADPNVQLYQSRFDTPFPVKNREFLQVRVYKEVNGEYFVMHHSINYDAAVGKDAVRAFSISIYVLRPVEGNPNATKLVLLAQVDPKGNIPSFVVSLGKSKGAEALQNIRKRFQK